MLAFLTKELAMTRHTDTSRRAQAASETAPVCCFEPLESRDLLSAAPIAYYFPPLPKTSAPALHILAPTVVTPKVTAPTTPITPIRPAVTGVSAVSAGTTNLVSAVS